jgi:TRAP-type C4-dicarboxylate transport system permease small subunit
MPQYRLAATAEAERLDATAETFSALARRDVQRATNYVLAVVLFAASLFFAGISTKLSQPKLRVATVALGSVLFVVTLVWVATSPVSVSV